jgi:hypothetical protein
MKIFHIQIERQLGKEKLKYKSTIFFYEKSRSGKTAGAIHDQTYKDTHIQLDTILTQRDA